MQFLSDFADQAVTLPALGLTCCALLAIGWRRAALALAGSAVAVLVVVTAGKLAFMTCPALASNAWSLQSPSGHTAMAAFLYGGLVAMMIRSRHRVWIALSCAVAAALAIGVSRLALGVHSAADVAAGTAIGAAGACAMVWAAGPRPVLPAGNPVIVPAAVALALLLHGRHLHAEATLSAYARLIMPPPLCQNEAEAGVSARASHVAELLSGLPRTE